MLIFRTCPICHEKFDTSDHKQKYCCEYCKAQAKEKKPQKTNKQQHGGMK